MKQIACFLVFLCFGIACFAQWSGNAGLPTLISGGAGEQALPKVAIAPDGKTYISYFDNSSGGYKVWLKLLDMDGVAVWPDPKGIEMSGSISDTWLTDYDLCTDTEGNALITIQDIRTGYNSVFIYKVSPEGTQLWGETGLGLSTNASSNSVDYSPVVITIADNSTYVAWQHQSSPAQVMVQRLDSQGQTQWTNPLVLSVPSSSTSWPQFVESTAGSVLVKYYADSGPFWAPNRAIRTAKLSPQGQIIWDQVISDAYGISAWTQEIGFASDGAGGAVLSWHDDRDQNNLNQAFFARITSDGLITTPEDGAYVSNAAFYHQFYPWVSCDLAAQEARVAMRITDGNQNLAGLIVQVLDYNGNRLLGEDGLLRQSLSDTNFDPLFVWNYNGSFHYLYYSQEFASSQFQAIRSSHNPVPDQYNTWFDGHIASTNTAKMHYEFDSHPGGWVICTWEDGSSGNDIYAMRYWHNGNVGAFNGAPENLVLEFIPPSSIRIQWDPPQYSEPLVYQVQLNNLLETVPASETEHIFADLQSGIYTALVTAVYPGQIESPSAVASLEIVVVGSDDPILNPMLVTVAPNPFVTATQVKWVAELPGLSYLSLYNIRGQRVFHEQLSLDKGQQSYSLPLADLPAGVYFLRLQNGAGQHSRKLIKLR